MEKKVGIKATQKVIGTSLQNEWRNANDRKAGVCWLHGPALWWGAVSNYISNSWHRVVFVFSNQREKRRRASSRGKKMKLEQDPKKFMDLGENSAVVSFEKRKKLIDEYSRLMYENVWVMPTVEKVKYSVITSKRLGNVPYKGFGVEANFGAEQFFFKR